jgi:type IV pilus assembly protein PilP
MRTLQEALRLTPLFVFVMVATGCVSYDISDLEQYTKEVLARPGGRIEPIPEIKPYEAYTYKSGISEARNPFQLFYVKTEEELAVEDSGLTAEMEKEIKHRNREELEQYELDSLRMVGTLEDTGAQWGIILDPTGTVHRIKVGNYLGKNVGKILNIYEDKIELREIIRNPLGQWEERPAAIALAEE